MPIVELPPAPRAIWMGVESAPTAPTLPQLPIQGEYQEICEAGHSTISARDFSLGSPEDIGSEGKPDSLLRRVELLATRDLDPFGEFLTISSYEDDVTGERKKWMTVEVSNKQASPERFIDAVNGFIAGTRANLIPSPEVNDRFTLAVYGGARQDPAELDFREPISDQHPPIAVQHDFSEALNNARRVIISGNAQHFELMHGHVELTVRTGDYENKGPLFYAVQHFLADLHSQALDPVLLGPDISDESFGPMIELIQTDPTYAL